MMKKNKFSLLVLLLVAFFALYTRFSIDFDMSYLVMCMIGLAVVGFVVLTNGKDFANNLPWLTALSMLVLAVSFRYANVPPSFSPWDIASAYIGRSITQLLSYEFYLFVPLAALVLLYFLDKGQFLPLLILRYLSTAYVLLLVNISSPLSLYLSFGSSKLLQNPFNKPLLIFCGIFLLQDTFICLENHTRTKIHYRTFCALSIYYILLENATLYLRDVTPLENLFSGELWPYASIVIALVAVALLLDTDAVAPTQNQRMALYCFVWSIYSFFIHFRPEFYNFYVMILGAQLCPLLVIRMLRNVPLPKGALPQFSLFCVLSCLVMLAGGRTANLNPLYFRYAVGILIAWYLFNLLSVRFTKESTEAFSSGISCALLLVCTNLSWLDTSQASLRVVVIAMMIVVWWMLCSCNSKLKKTYVDFSRSEYNGVLTVQRYIPCMLFGAATLCLLFR